MKRTWVILAAMFALAVAATVPACDVVKQLAGAYNMTSCKYDYRSLTGVSVAGINVSDGISLLEAPRILSLITGVGGASGGIGGTGAGGASGGAGASAASGGTGAGSGMSIPIGCTVNLDVTNPNSSAAILNGMDYVLAIDGIDFTSGSVAQQLSVAPGGTGSLPLALTFDVATLLRGESRDAVIGVVRNLVGMSGLGSGATGQPSRVTLNIKPSFNFAGRQVASPVYIPINFTLGQ